jgi:Cof subfamily protein (haloacid dehalogenase superfamily)
MSANIELIATDLDGTLLHTSHDISPANMAAMSAAVAGGITICIATGRSHASASQFARRLGLDESLIISYNGAMIRRCNDDEPMLHTTVPADSAKAVVRHCLAQRWYLQYFINDSYYVTHISRWGRLYLARTGDIPIPVGDLRRFDGQTPTKLLIATDPAVIASTFPHEQQLWQPELFVTHSMPEYIEYLNPNATKGKALAWLCRYLNISPENTMAIGDQLNDLPMLQQAAIAVAMPSACEQVRAEADYVPNSDRDGVAEALKHYLDL